MSEQLTYPQFPVIRFGSFRLLFLMATEAEYGENLKALFRPVIIGVGPIEAAITTTAVLAKIAWQSVLPDLVVSLGSAGSATLERTEVYQVGSVAWRDMDASILGVEKGVTPFLGLPAKLSMPVFSEDLPVACLSTSGNMFSRKDYQTLDADMVDMETYAVLRTCQHFGVPLIGLRGISDGWEDLHHMDDWKQYLHIIDKKLASAIIMLKNRLEQEKDLTFLSTDMGGKMIVQAVNC